MQYLSCVRAGCCFLAGLDLSVVKKSTWDSFRKALNDEDPSPIIQEGLQEDNKAQNLSYRHNVYVHLTIFSHKNIWRKLSEPVKCLLKIIGVDKEITKLCTKCTILSCLTERETCRDSPPACRFWIPPRYSDPQLSQIIPFLPTI